MSPAAWLEANGKTESDIAAELETPSSTIHRMLVGERFPSFPVLYLFHKLSAGSVGLEDWAAIFRAKKGALPASRMQPAPLRRLLKPRPEAKDGNASKGGRRRQAKRSEPV